MDKERIHYVKPGMFGGEVAADHRRTEFDVQNEVILTHGIDVDFVFIGDSITHWWDIHSYFGRGNNLALVNRGIGGDVTKHVLRRFEADVMQLKPKHVIVLAGVNDFWALDGWTDNDRREPEQLIPDIVENIHKMIKLAKENEIVPVICSILPTHLPSSGNDAKRNAAIQSVNVQLRKICSVEGAIYVDYHTHFTTEDNSRLRPGLADDGLHPHVHGYDIMARVLREELAKHHILL